MTPVSASFGTLVSFT